MRLTNGVGTGLAGLALVLMLAFNGLNCLKEREKSVELKDFVVNLADEEGSRFLKIKMKLVVESNNVVAEIAESDARISDAVIMFLRSKRVADLKSSMGMKVLKQQLLDLFNNQLLKKGDVKDIYFINFVIQ